MNLIFRLLAVWLQSFLKPVIDPIEHGSILKMRVWPQDLDTNWHMNNGRYLTLMDLGRFDLILHAGMLKAAIKQKWAPVLGAATMRFRMPLNAFQPFELHTRILGWTENWLFIEQRFILTRGPRKGAVAAIGLVRGGLYNNRLQMLVPVRDILALAGQDPDEPSPALPDYVAAWQASEEALKAATPRPQPKERDQAC